jgi:hypothetical protein
MTMDISLTIILVLSIIMVMIISIIMIIIVSILFRGVPLIVIRIVVTKSNPMGKRTVLFKEAVSPE